MPAIRSPGRSPQFTVAIFLVAALAVTLASARMLKASAPGALDAAEEQAFRRAGNSVAKSLVRIQTIGGVDRVGRLLTGTAATTGVIVSPDGFIISSAFNFIAKPSSILIQLSDGRPYTARLVATDHLRMLTLLKIDAAELEPLRLQGDRKVRVGQWSIAVGRTYDSSEPSLSVGVVSALNRVWGKAIQTDAKVSPVNYGGPLVDIAGNVLGVVVPLSPTAKEETAGVEWYDSGIGFAIPLVDVLASAERLKAGKDLYAGLLGVTVKEAGIDDPAAIDLVRFDSPAERAGFKSGDVITEIDGHPVRRYDEVKLALGRRYAGDKVTVVVRRGNATVRADAQLIDALPPYEPGFLGILPARQMAEGQRGVQVRFVFPHSPAEASGIAIGDQIRKFNGTEIANAEQLASLVRRVRPGKAASLVFVHRGTETTKTATLGADVEEVPTDLPAFRAQSPATQEPAKKVDENKPKTGHFRETLAGEQGPSFWAYVPENYSPRDSWGLVVWIAPPRDPMEAAMLSRWQGPCDERRFIIVAPAPAEAAGFNPTDLVATRQVVEHFLKLYRIDRSRIVVHGYAGGGPFASIFAFDNRERIRGLALASSPVMGPAPDSHPNYPLRLFFSYGEKDRQKERLQRAAEILRGMKFSVTVQTTADRERQYLSAADVAGLARWIDTLDRI